MQVLSNRAYDRFHAYLERVVEANQLPDGVDVFSAVSRNFSVEPSVQQILTDKLTEDHSLLGSINIELVRELKGDKLGLGLDGKVIASRTDTNVEPRVTKSVYALDDDKYECREVQFDTHLKYSDIDRWAKYDDFEARIAKHLINAQRADRLKIGFNGKGHAPKTNREANPLGEDVNIGWLERLRLNAPARVSNSGKVNGKITFGEGAAADFATLDGLVISAINEMIDPWNQSRTDLVVLVSRELLGDHYFDLYNKAQPPSEKLAAQAIGLQHRIGRCPAMMAPWFPQKTIVITPLSNLSIYEQEGSRRRKIEDNASRSRFDDFESFNEDYVIEDYGAMAMIENVEELEA